MITLTESSLTWGAIVKSTGDLMWVFPTEGAAKEFSATCPIPTVAKLIEWQIADEAQQVSTAEIDAFFLKLRRDVLASVKTKGNVASTEERLKTLIEEYRQLKEENKELMNRLASVT